MKKITRITDKQKIAISVAEIKIKGLSQLVQQTNKTSSAQKKFDDEHNEHGATSQQSIAFMVGVEEMNQLIRKSQTKSEEQLAVAIEQLNQSHHL